MAELTEVRHDSVKRTIDALVARGIIASPQIVETLFTGSDGRKQTVTQYLVGKRDSYVIVAQLSPEFTGRLVDRWNELETQPQVETRAKPKAISSTEAFKGFFQVGKLLGLVIPPPLSKTGRTNSARQASTPEKVFSGNATFIGPRLQGAEFWVAMSNTQGRHLKARRKPRRGLRWRIL